RRPGGPAAVPHPPGDEGAVHVGLHRQPAGPQWRPGRPGGLFGEAVHAGNAGPGGARGARRQRQASRAETLIGPAPGAGRRRSAGSFTITGPVTSGLPAASTTKSTTPRATSGQVGRWKGVHSATTTGIGFAPGRNQSCDPLSPSHSIHGSVPRTP